MTASEPQTLPARRGRAVRLRKGQALKIVNTHGQQVVDSWAFNADDELAEVCRWSTCAKC